MAARALIIGIENYPGAVGIASELPGTLESAIAFRDWLRGKWKREGVTDVQIVFCSEPRVRGGRGATARDIRKALQFLHAEGQNATDELFVYFSGHGFTYNTPEDRSDILVAGDYEDAALSSDSCLPLDQLVYWLRRALGPGRHYYFIDACRNALDGATILRGRILPPTSQTSGEASTFILQSVQPGEVAEADGDFAKHLLGGLSGTGIAKAWDDRFSNAMVVRFDSLRDHLNAVVKRRPVYGRIEGIEGERAAILATLRPVPTVKCLVQVEGLAEGARGRLSAIGFRRNERSSHDIVGPSSEIALRPDDYRVSLKVKGQHVQPAYGVEVSAYDDVSASFEVSDEPLAPQKKQLFEHEFDGESYHAPDPSISKTPRLRIRGRKAGAIKLTKKAKKTKAAHPDRKWLRARRAVPVAAKPDVNISRRSIAAFFSEDGQGTPVFHSRVRTAGDKDLDRWLALCGAARILHSGSYGRRRLDELPLEKFDSLEAGTASVYILAGFEKRTTKLSVGLSHEADVRWRQAGQPRNMPGLKQSVMDATPGAWLVSFRIGNDLPYTIATCAMANRVTLITVTMGEHRIPQIGQFILPAGHLLSELPREMRARLAGRDQLKDVWQMSDWLRAFRNRGNTLDAMGRRELDEILYTKWLDPVTSAMACYELIRRGFINRLSKSPVIANLRTYFSDLPDVEAIATLCGLTRDVAAGTPLFMDGLDALSKLEARLPLDAGRLELRSPWTMWRGAVTV